MKSVGSAGGASPQMAESQAPFLPPFEGVTVREEEDAGSGKRIRGDVAGDQPSRDHTNDSKSTAVAHDLFPWRTQKSCGKICNICTEKKQDLRVLSNPLAMDV
jgi:hypothetical protein